MNWLRFDKDTIFEGKDAHGNRYLNQFLNDYERVFNITDFNAGCKKCLDEYYNKLITHLQMGNTTEPKVYQLKAKYNGIPLKFGSSILVNNLNITKEYAEELIKNHPRGIDLFDAFPERSPEDFFKNLKRADLDKIATDLGLDPKDYPNSALIKEAITEAKATSE